MDLEAPVLVGGRRVKSLNPAANSSKSGAILAATPASSSSSTKQQQQHLQQHGSLSSSSSERVRFLEFPPPPSHDFPPTNIGGSPSGHSRNCSIDSGNCPSSTSTSSASDDDHDASEQVGHRIGSTSAQSSNLPRAIISHQQKTHQKRASSRAAMNGATGGGLMNMNVNRTAYRTTMDDGDPELTKDTVCIIESEQLNCHNSGAKSLGSRQQHLQHHQQQQNHHFHHQHHQQQQLQHLQPQHKLKSYSNTVHSSPTTPTKTSYQNFLDSATADDSSYCCGAVGQAAASNSKMHGTGFCSSRKGGTITTTTNHGNRLGNDSHCGGGSSDSYPSANASRMFAAKEPQMKWTRNNIAATMERYEPSTSSSSSMSSCHSHHGVSGATSQQQPPHQSSSAHFHHHQQDYSYAYYEPGVAMRHANIPCSNNNNNTNNVPMNTAPGSSHLAASSSSSASATPGPSQALPPPPPNSMRALLMKCHRNQVPPSLTPNWPPSAAAGSSFAARPTTRISDGLSAGGGVTTVRHTYTTRYGTQENIYEEIGNEDRLRLMMASGQSMVSLHQSMVEEEFRQVHNRHRRVLGELNLSVEAMIMPVTPPNESPNDDEADEDEDGISLAALSTHHQQQDGGGGSSKRAARHRNEFMMKPIVHSTVTGGTTSGDLMGAVAGPSSGGGAECNTSSITNADLDSGFSGSSSGASYVGSLRYQKSSAAAAAAACCPGNNNSNSNTSMTPSHHLRLSRRSYEDPGLSFSTRSSSSYGSSKSHHHLHSHPPQHAVLKSATAEDPGPSTAHIISLHNCNALYPAAAAAPTGVKPASKNASFWSKKGWKMFPGFSNNGQSTAAMAGQGSGSSYGGSSSGGGPMNSQANTVVAFNGKTMARVHAEQTLN